MSLVLEVGDLKVYLQLPSYFVLDSDPRNIRKWTDIEQQRAFLERLAPEFGITQVANSLAVEILLKL